MTENGARPSGKNGRHPPPLTADPPDTNDVDAAMKLMKLAALQTLHDRNPPQADLQQLPASYHPMLSPSQLRNRSILHASGRFDIDSASS
jgi:hypothetical protein